MTPGPTRAVIEDGRVAAVPDPAAAIDHFRKVLVRTREAPSPADILAKQRLHYFCGHIEPGYGRRGTYIPMAVVAEHFTSLTPVAAQETPRSFAEDLTTYLSLLSGIEYRAGEALPEFRGAVVSLTFDFARLEENIRRFVDDGAALTFDKRYEVPRNMGR